MAHDLAPEPAGPVLVCSDAVQNQLEFGGPVGEALESRDGWHFAPVPAKGEAPAEPEGLRLKTSAEVEREHVAFAIQFYGWNISRTAIALNVDRRTLHRQLDKLGMRRPGPVVEEGFLYTFRVAPEPELVAEHPGGLLRDVLIGDSDPPAEPAPESKTIITHLPYELGDICSCSKCREHGPGGTCEGGS